MKYIIVLCLCALASSTSLAQDLRKEIAACAAIENSVERLHAYDTLAARLGVDKPATTSETEAGKWKLRTDTSPMDDKKSFYLSLDADSPVRTGYKSGTPSLLIRYKEKKFECFINYSFFLGSDSTEVTHRLDQGQPKTLEWSISTDHEAVFPPGDGKAFVTALMKANSLVIRLTPYSESPVTTTFDLRGLSEAMSPIVQAMKNPYRDREPHR